MIQAMQYVSASELEIMLCPRFAGGNSDTTGKDARSNETNGFDMLGSLPSLTHLLQRTGIPAVRLGLRGGINAISKTFSSTDKFGTSVLVSVPLVALADMLFQFGGHEACRCFAPGECLAVHGARCRSGQGATHG